MSDFTSYMLCMPDQGKISLAANFVGRFQMSLEYGTGLYEVNCSVNKVPYLHASVHLARAARDWITALYASKTR